MKGGQSRARRSHRTDPAQPGFSKVTAIVRCSVLEKVEERPQSLQVPGISVTKVKGYGECANFFREDWMVEHARIEIVLRRERSDEIVRAIAGAARTGLPGDGIVIVESVESVYRVRSGEQATSEEVGGSGSVTPRQDPPDVVTT